MKPLILSVALIAIASCASCRNTTNTNSVTQIASEKASGPETNKKESCLNLNSATSDQLIKLPGVGEVMAEKIIDYRARHGRFRRPQEIIIIEGFSERKYRDIAGMICVE